MHAPRYKQPFGPYADSLLRLTLAAVILVGAVAGGIAYEVNQPRYVRAVGLTIEQPVPFSHRHHVAELGLDCRYCHAGAGTSPFAGMPATEICMTCHSQILAQSPMLAPVRKSFAENKPIAWNRVNQLPDFVYFSHEAHVTHGIECRQCHGDVQNMALTRQAVELSMKFCLSCHRDPVPKQVAQSEVYPTSPVAERLSAFDKREWVSLTKIEPARQPAEPMAALLKAHIQPGAAQLTNCSVCHR